MVIGSHRGEVLESLVGWSAPRRVRLWLSWLPRWLNWSELGLLAGDGGLARGRLAGRPGLDCRAPAQVFTLAGRQRREEAGFSSVI